MSIAGWVLQTPWALAAFAVLPVLVWLLRLRPPAPRRMRFPAMMLLHGLERQEQTPQHTPWWLLLLRMLVISSLILAVAHPVQQRDQTATPTGPALFVIDNSWAAARHWQKTQQAATRLLQALDPAAQVWLLPTAVDADTAKLRLHGPLTVVTAQRMVDQLTPEPWSADYDSARALVSDAGLPDKIDSYWISDGFRPQGALDLLISLQQRGQAQLFGWRQPLAILQGIHHMGELTLQVQRLGLKNAVNYTILGKDARDSVIWHQEISFSADQSSATTLLTAPVEIRRRIQSLQIGGQTNAAAAWLLDPRSEQTSIGLVGNQTALDEQPLLSDLFYLERAVEPFAKTTRAALNELLETDAAILFVTTPFPSEAETAGKLQRWIEQGGVLVQFANAVAAHDKPNPLWPVQVRAGDRNLGGAMSWTEPQTLAPFPPQSPFAGLSVPADIRITRQLLAEPAPDLSGRVWAALADGTPLVTAKQLGKGYTVLFHVTAQADWSTLPLSGLFVQMLQRLTMLANGQEAVLSESVLKPQRVLDAFGVWRSPGKAAQGVALDELATTLPDVHHPAGLYGAGSRSFALNLGNHLETLEEWPAGLLRDVDQPAPALDLQPWLLVLALALFFIDWIVVLVMQYGLRLRPVVPLTAFLIFICVSSSPAWAEAASEAAAKVTLAYVKSGQANVDAVSEQGLRSLARALTERTMLDDVGVTGIDPAIDDLAFYPLIYWPLTEQATRLSGAAAAHLNRFITSGGMLLLDTRQGDSSQNIELQRRLQGLLDQIAVPPLMPLPADHVLNKTFYLLKASPGRLNQGPLWIATSQASLDQVAPLMIGGNDWAAGWAETGRGIPAFTAIPGGASQHEMAMRFGVNLVVYALTGNYKADQIHSAQLIKRDDDDNANPLPFKLPAEEPPP